MTFTIGLDLDGVCYNWSKTARYMLRHHYLDTEREIPKELFQESTHWDYIKDSVSPEDWSWLWSTGIEQGLYRYGHIFPGAIEGAQRLSRLGDITIITARPKAAVHDTLVWLSMMFDKIPLAGIVIQSFGQKKSQVYPVPNVYIDDATHNARDVLDNTQKSCNHL